VPAAAGRPRGVEGVIDKDLTAALLAENLDAELLLLLTDVDAVYRDFDTPAACALPALTASEADELLASGQLDAGSMAPKVDAAARFARAGGTAIVSSLERVGEALGGAAGTRVSS
jgi:carbamate kinase